MPDPISILSATALALHAAHVTKDFISGITNAPKTVTFVLRDLEALEAVLQQLEIQLKKDPKLENPLNIETAQLIETPLKSCMVDLKNIKELLRKFVKPSGAAKTGKWSGLMFTFREKELRDLQYHLRDSKDTLEGGLLVGTYSIGLDSNVHIHSTNEGVQRLERRFVQYQLRRGEDQYSVANTSYARSDVLEPDVGSRIPQWLDGTETVRGDGDKFPPAMTIVEEEWGSRSTTPVQETAPLGAEGQAVEQVASSSTARNPVPEDTTQLDREQQFPGSFPARIEHAFDVDGFEYVNPKRNKTTSPERTAPASANATDTDGKTVGQQGTSSENWFHGLFNWSRTKSTEAIPSKDTGGPQNTGSKQRKSSRNAANMFGIVQSQTHSASSQRTAISSYMPQKSANDGKSHNSAGSSKNFTKPLRKTIVSRAALQALEIEFRDGGEREKTVLVNSEIEAKAIADARALSLQLSGANRQTWWSREQGSQNNPSRPQPRRTTHSTTATTTMAMGSATPEPTTTHALYPYGKNQYITVIAKQTLHPRTKAGAHNWTWRDGALELDRGDHIVVDVDVWCAASRLEWVTGRKGDTQGLFPKYMAEVSS